LNVPLDEALGITPYQASSEELIRLGCLLSIVMPYELSSWMLHQCTGIAVSASTLWNWVERYGASAKSRLEVQIEQYLQGESMPRESLDEVTAALRLAIAILNHFLKMTVLINFRKIKFLTINTKFK